MDRLDEQIMAAKKQYTPNKDFVKTTMNKINSTPTKQPRFSWFKTLAFSGAALALVLVATFVFMPKNTTDETSSPSEKTASTNSTADSSGSQSTTQAKTEAQKASDELSASIAELDKEVGSYTVSYSDTSLDNLNQ
jgi:hypothetical protein